MHEAGYSRYDDIPGVTCRFRGVDAISGAEGIVDGLPFYLEIRADGWTFGITGAQPGDPVLGDAMDAGYFDGGAWASPLAPAAVGRIEAVHLVTRGVRRYRESHGANPWERAAYDDFRILRWVVEYDAYYRVHRVYYDAAGTPIAVDLAIAEPFGDTEEEIRASCLAMAQAAAKPALDFHAFPTSAVRPG